MWPSRRNKRAFLMASGFYKGQGRHALGIGDKQKHSRSVLGTSFRHGYITGCPKSFLLPLVIVDQGDPECISGKSRLTLLCR